MKKILLTILLTVLFSAVGVSVFADEEETPAPIQNGGVPLWALVAENKLNQQRDAFLNNWFDNYRAGVVLPFTADDMYIYTRLTDFLSVNGYPSVEVGTLVNMVYRDNQDNFYFEGLHIDLPKFKSLGINADFVARGQTVELSLAK